MPVLRQSVNGGLEMGEFKSVGKNVTRVDIRALKVTGRAKYAEISICLAWFTAKSSAVWSMLMRKVKSIDFSEAKKMPGVIKTLGPRGCHS